MEKEGEGVAEGTAEGKRVGGKGRKRERRGGEAEEWRKRVNAQCASRTRHRTGTLSFSPRTGEKSASAFGRLMENLAAR